MKPNKEILMASRSSLTLLNVLYVIRSNEFAEFSTVQTLFYTVLIMKVISSIIDSGVMFNDWTIGWYKNTNTFKEASSGQQ